MSWKIVWSDFAESELDSILNYYLENTSAQVASRLVKGIINSTSRLLQNQNLGQVEGMLRELDLEYRYILYKKYKIVYSVDSVAKLIKIADVFDMRQHPEKLKRNK